MTLRKREIAHFKDPSYRRGTVPWLRAKPALARISFRERSEAAEMPADARKATEADVGILKYVEEGRQSLTPQTQVDTPPQ